MADKNKIKKAKRSRIKKHIRKKVFGTAERPRLVVYRSAKNIYAQLVNDVEHKTITAFSTLSPDLQKDLTSVNSKIEAAKLVGKGIAEKATKMKIKQVVFDRGGYLFHGRVKAVADGAREHGLTF
ncbi:MAG: 50S ribosomal protein L18 [bacterium]